MNKKLCAVISAAGLLFTGCGSDAPVESEPELSEQITPFEPETLLAGKRKEFPYITDDQCFSDDVTPYSKRGIHLRRYRFGGNS